MLHGISICSKACQLFRFDMFRAYGVCNEVLSGIVTIGGLVFSWVHPKMLYMGEGAIESLEGILRLLEPKGILMVTGPHVRKLGIADQALEAMGSYRHRVELFINPKPEPELSVVEQCAQQVREQRYDLIIGLGGGSPLAVAKGAAVVAVHEGGMKPLLGVNRLKRKGIATVLIPTTAGSGTDVTQAVVVGVPEEDSKKSIWDPRTMAEAVIVDPTLMMRMSPRLTAETGLDALVHAMEGYTARGSNPLSRMYTIEAMRLIGAYLPKAYRNGADMEAREAMARGATLAGIGMTNSGLGGIHGLALGIDSREHFNHCRSLAVLAPWVMRFNRVGNETLYADIAKALGERVEDCSVDEASYKAFEAVLRIFDEIEVSPYLKDYGIKKDEIRSLALKAYTVGQRLLPMNCREISQEDATALFEQAFGG